MLALDTATPAVTAGVVRLDPAPPAGRRQVLAQRVARDPRKHGELLMPGVLAACAEAGLSLRELDAIVVGAGPGPFTGLRVGMVTGAALGDALGIPVYGVCSLDAICCAAIVAGAPDGAPGGTVRLPGNLLVATDARRKEVYWAAYTPEGARLAGPAVARPEVVAAELAGLGVGAAAGTMAGLFGLPVHEPAEPTPAGLVAVAAEALRSGAGPAPLEPLYLRRPDAVPPGERKRVSLERSPA